MRNSRRIKVIALGLMGGVLTALLLATQVSAGSPATLAVGSATIAPGESTTVSITTNVADPGLGAWTVDVNVQNPSQLTIVRCAAESHSVCNPDFNASLPTARYAGASATGLVGRLTLGTITVRCANREGSSGLGLDTVGFADPTLGGPIEIPVTLSPGTVRCVAPVVAATATRTGGGPAPTATIAAGLPPTGSGGAGGSGTLPMFIAALAGVGIAGIAAYRGVRLRARNS